MDKTETERGIFAIIVVLTFVVLALVVGVLFFIKTNGDRGTADYVRNLYQKKPIPSVTTVPTISDSDDTEVIEKELDDTDLGIDDLEKELDDLDTDASSL